MYFMQANKPLLYPSLGLCYGVLGYVVYDLGLSIHTIVPTIILAVFATLSLTWYHKSLQQKSRRQRKTVRGL